MTTHTASSVTELLRQHYNPDGQRHKPTTDAASPMWSDYRSALREGERR